jgi:16S rRNA U516 pseudouridylate synthase RsuA-like enzyme
LFMKFLILDLAPKKKRDERHGPTSWASITVNEGKFRQIRKWLLLLVFLPCDWFVFG